MKPPGYSYLFHAVYPLRDSLRNRRVIILGTGDAEGKLVAALRALDVQPTCAITESPDTGLFYGVRVCAVDQIDSSEYDGAFFLIADPSLGSWAERWLGRWKIPVADYVRLFEPGVDVPSQPLSAVDACLRATPKTIAARKKRERTQRDFRYRWAQRISRFLFYAHFISSRAGWQYGIRRRDKWKLLIRAFRNQKHFQSLSTPPQQLWLCHELFKVPIRTRGDVAECGCYDGASTAMLSMACKMVGRKLYVCDSFEGLPEPEADEQVTIRTGSTFYHWKAGEFASPGGLEGVRQRVEQFGAIEACEFVKGYFCQTLPDLPTDSLVLVFEDADLKSSVLDCVRHLWPRLRFGCKFFSHEPWSIDVVSIFYDHAFWKSAFGTPPPGFYGGDLGGIRALMVYFNL